MSNVAVVLIGILAGLMWFFHQDLKEIKETQVRQLSINEQQAVNFNTISKRLDVTETDRIIEIRALKNKETLGDISCGKCHNPDSNALPINKLTAEEAYQIVREGNDRSKEGGMPIYLSANVQKGQAYISDSVLRTILEKLYTPELLKVAKEPKK